MAKWRNITKVERFTNEATAYRIEFELQLFDGDDFEFDVYFARPNGGGLCDELIDYIETEWAGEIGSFNPEAPENVIPETQTYSKAFLFQAMSDEEYTTFELVMSQQSARNQAIFNNATQIESDNSLTQLLIEGMKTAYGETRTQELLDAARI